MSSDPTALDSPRDSPLAHPGPLEDGGSAERVELSMPAHPEMWTLARMTVSVVAARIELGYEEISDLRLAIDELCTLCALGSTDDSRLTLTCSTDEHGVRIDCTVAPVAGGQSADEHAAGLFPAQLSERILEALVDAHGVSEEDGVRRGWLWKLRPPS